MHSTPKKIITLIVVQALFLELLLPAGVAIALTGGPTQPEFSTFEPVGTSGMVNPLTGQFSYNLPVLNIPGPNGAGYPISLSYHAGSSPEEEASWVGQGWTLNPGAINRMKRGFPDDYDGDTVRYWNRVEENWTVTATLTENTESFGVQPLAISGSTSIRYNNYKGFAYTAGVAALVKGFASLQFNFSTDNGLGFTPGIRPAELLGELGLESRSLSGPDWLASTVHNVGVKSLELLASRANRHAMYTIANEIRPTAFQSYEGVSVDFTLEALFPPGPPPVGPNVGIAGSYTVQKPANGGLTQLRSYGYMYSAHADTADMMDYYVEKESPYTKRDRFLSVPFSNADLYSITGQGIGGGFRLFNKKPGQFHPNETRSRTWSGDFSFQGHLGPLNIGTGAGIGLGEHSLTVDSWLDPLSIYSFASESDGDEPYFFRMNNDLGGSVLFDDDDNAFKADLNNIIPIWGFQSFSMELNSSGVYQMNRGNRSGRSTYIGYSTVREILEAPLIDEGLYPNFQAYDNDEPRRLLYSDPKSRVSEFSATTPEGMRYAYGLPVYSRKEKNLQYGLQYEDLGDVVDEQRHLAYVNATPHNWPIVVGEERDAPYATSYLLTNITTPDYIDRRTDGLTPDDFGGYTKFNYIKTAGEGVDYATLNHNPETDPQEPGPTPATVRRTPSTRVDPDQWADPAKPDTNGWYKWRVPYRGLLYQPNSLSDTKDDMGGMSMGEREMYYLSTIETKTHVAVFVTNAGLYKYGHFFEGSGEHRKDGYEAVHHEYDVTGNDAATRAVDADGQAPNQLRKLERIELWSHDTLGNLKELVQTVHFEYDYSTGRGLPNAYTETGQPLTGKLTLKRVYFEYNGVVNAKISPYVFGYEYRTESGAHYAGLPSEVLAKYDNASAASSIISYGEQWSAAVQNPDYAPYQVGRWGFYQHDGVNRHYRLNPWESQTPSTTGFDPAAWQLKWIRLPSGGEIHVQYEQNDYAYVQDRVAMVMVPLLGADMENDKYYLDVEGGLGISTSDGKDSLVDAMRSLFVDGKEKIFFRALHSLDGSVADIDEIEEGRQDFITGYAGIIEVGKEGSGTYSGKIYVRMSHDNNSTPTDAALAFANTSRAGIVGDGKGIRNEGDASTRGRSLIGNVGTSYTSERSDWTSTDIIDWANSYVRVPLGKRNRDGKGDKIVRAKKGGGFRVKRVVMYDPGLESGGGHLFGSEYIYETVEKYSSGVASNEPTDGREESALVRLLDRRADQNWFEWFISGGDREQFEGPIGESLLPSPAVTYSRVAVRSIHTGVTNPSFTIHEYHTAKDFPFQCIYSSEQIDGTTVTPLDPSTDPMMIVAPGISYSTSNIWATQGYRFIVHDMQGQIKKIATYGGDFNSPPSSWIESSSQEYSYFEPGEKVPMLYDYTTQPTWKMEDPGKEMEIVLEGRSVEDVHIDAGTSIDASIGIVPFTFLSVVGNINYAESKLKTHVISKVIRYPAILKKVVARQDGILNTTENIGFNPLTGQPIVSRMGDAYAGVQREWGGGTLYGMHNRSYKAFTYPAALEYREMGQKSHNERVVLATEPDKLKIDKRLDAGKHYLSFQYPGEGASCKVSDLLGAGDLIEVYIAYQNENLPYGTFGVYHVEKTSGNRAILQPHSASVPTEWIPNVSVRVLRSGHTNQLSAPRAGITVYTPD